MMCCRIMLFAALPFLTGCQTRDCAQSAVIGCQQTTEALLPLLYLTVMVLEILAPFAAP